MHELSQGKATQECDNVITLSEMAKILKISPLTLKKYVLNHEVTGYFAANKKVYFLRSDFDRSFFVDNGMLTCKDVANKMRVDPRTVRRWIDTGLLVAQKLGKQWWINNDDYLDFLELGAYNE